MDAIETPQISAVAANFHDNAVAAMAAHTDGQLSRTDMQNIRADARAVVDALPKHHADSMRDAAVEQARERAAERREVEKIVLGARSFDRRDRLGDIVKLGDDYVVEVEKTGHDTTWTTVVGGKRSFWHHHTQEAAILHLIARRYDDNDNSNHQAAFYAGRVLGIKEAK